MRSSSDSTKSAKFPRSDVAGVYGRRAAIARRLLSQNRSTDGKGCSALSACEPTCHLADRGRCVGAERRAVHCITNCGSGGHAARGGRVDAGWLWIGHDVVGDRSGGWLAGAAGAAYAGGAVYAGGPDYVAKTDLATHATTVFAGAPGTTGCTDGATGAASTFNGIKDLATDGTFLYSVSSCGLRKTSLATGATSAVAGTPGSVVGVAAASGLLYLTVSYYYGTVYQLDPASGALTTLASLLGCCNPSSVFGITADATYAYVLTIDYNNSGYEYGQAIQRIKLSDHAVSTLVADGTLLQSTIESVGSDLYVGAVIPGGGDGPILRRVSKADGSWSVLAGSGTGYLDGTGTDAWFATISDLASDGTNIYVSLHHLNRPRAGWAGRDLGRQDQHLPR